MEILLLRHGMTAGNADGCYIGRTDLPVLPQGLEELRAMGSDDSVERVYVTPLRRTQQTASLFFPKAEQIVVDDLIEKDFGDFEGRSAEEMADDPAYRQWVAEGAIGACPNGESMEAFVQRIQRGFCCLVEEALARGDERLVLVGHGGAFMALMISFAHDGRDYYAWFAPNGGGWRARIDPRTWGKERRLMDVRAVLGPLEK